MLVCLRCTAMTAALCNDKFLNFVASKVQTSGSLVFPPFRAEDYKQDVHAQFYRCVARNPAGSIVSRDIHVRAGNHFPILSFERGSSPRYTLPSAVNIELGAISVYRSSNRSLPFWGLEASRLEFHKNFDNHLQGYDFLKNKKIKK